MEKVQKKANQRTVVCVPYDPRLLGITTILRSAWDGEEVASVGEGEEGGLAGGAELGDPNLAWGPALPMKLQVWWLGIWFIVSLWLLL